MKRTHALLPLLAVALHAGTAAAVDGVLEINQTCAALSGCFPGDTAGFPVTIDPTTPGLSFRLTSDLEVPDTNPGGILVKVPVNDVSIDLNGFSIVRAACVALQYFTCAPTSGSSAGIEHENPASYRGPSVSNGSVVGMGANGLNVGRDVVITNVRARWNRLDGISGNGVISGNTSRENGGTGILGIDSVVSDNQVIGNGADGILGTGVVTGNLVVGNGGDGIRAAGAGDLVERNRITGNTGVGLVLNSSEAGYRGNVVSGNTAGTVSGGVDMGGNVCDGSATCP